MTIKGYAERKIHKLAESWLAAWVAGEDWPTIAERSNYSESTIKNHVGKLRSWYRDNGQTPPDRAASRSDDEVLGMRCWKLRLQGRGWQGVANQIMSASPKIELTAQRAKYLAERFRQAQKRGEAIAIGSNENEARRVALAGAEVVNRQYARLHPHMRRNDVPPLARSALAQRMVARAREREAAEAQMKAPPEEAFKLRVKTRKDAEERFLER